MALQSSHPTREVFNYKGVLVGVYQSTIICNLERCNLQLSLYQILSPEALHQLSDLAARIMIPSSLTREIRCLSRASIC